MTPNRIIDRRAFLAGSAAFATACAARPTQALRVTADFRALRESLGEGGRLGVAAYDEGSGRWLVQDEQSRYAMCSTFKLPLAAAILHEAERGRLSLEEEIAFTRADLIDHAPVVGANLSVGRLSVERLCAAAVEVSDNSAANLLLARIGGPEGLTRFIRQCGDSVTRLDRNEPSLNTNLPGDPRDTTTPAAMIGLLRALLLGRVLRRASSGLLARWMKGSTTGRNRLRAGLPTDWEVGDKTGTGNGANNDIAVAWPPGRPPILIATYTSGPAQGPARNAVHASVARAVAAAFA